MAVDFPSSAQATSSDAGGSGTPSVSVSPPSGLAAGDTWVIVGVLDRDPNAATDINVPAGFSAIHAAVVGDPGYPIVRSFYKIAGSSESAVTVSANGTGYVLWCASVRATGAHASSPIGNVATANPSGTGTTQDAPDVTVQNDGSGALLICAASPTSSTIAPWAAPSGATLVQSRNTPWPLGAVAYELRNAGSYTPGNWTITAATANEGRIGITIEVVPASGGGAPAPSITSVDGDNAITSDQTDVGIAGSDFDAATVEIRQGLVTVAQSIDSQNATTIVFDVVFDTASADLKYGAATLAVINADDQEDTIGITINPPSGNLYVDVGTPNGEASNRITAVPDIESGDQIEARGVGGGATPAGLTLNADATFSFSSGNTPAAFDVRIWDVNDATWGDWATQSIHHELDVAGAAHGHTSGGVTLSVQQALSVDGAVHGHASGEITLVQAHLLDVDDAGHGHVAGGMTLSLSLQLAVADIAHAQIAAAVDLVQAHVLSIAGSAHGHAAAGVTFTQDSIVTVLAAVHAQVAVSVDFTQQNILAVDGAVHGQVSGDVTFVQAHVLSVGNAVHAHVVHGIELAETLLLAVESAMHDLVAEEADITAGDVLAVASAVHLHLAGAIDLTQAHVLIVSDAVHAQIAELVDVRLPGLAASREVFMITAEDRIYLIAPETQRVVN